LIFLTEGEGKVSAAGGPEEDEAALIGIGSLDAQFGQAQGQLQGAELIRSRFIVFTNPEKIKFQKICAFKSKL
jgi:hypothetical protein